MRRGTFFTTDIASIGDEEYHNTDSEEILISNDEEIAVTGVGTCGSTAANNISFYFAIMVNGIWSDDPDDDAVPSNPYTVLHVVQKSSKVVAGSAIIDVGPAERIKITKIYNGATDNTNGDVSLVNCHYSIKKGIGT